MGAESFLKDANIVQEDLPADNQIHGTGAVRAGDPWASATAALGRKRLDYGKRKWEDWTKKFG